MKITGQNINRSVGNTETAKTDKMGSNKSDASQSNKNAAALGSGSLDASSKVNLSERAQAMQKAKDIAGDQSIDEAKVARLQKLIDSGEYKVDAKSVADRLVDQHLMMPE